jgi:hypothetical protein
VDASAAANSSGWSPQELQRIGDADELQIASRPSEFARGLFGRGLAGRARNATSGCFGFDGVE